MSKYDRDRGGLTQREFFNLDYMFPTIDAYKFIGDRYDGILLIYPSGRTDVTQRQYLQRPC